MLADRAFDDNPTDKMQPIYFGRCRWRERDRETEGETEGGREGTSMCAPKACPPQSRKRQNSHTHNNTTLLVCRQEARAADVETFGRDRWNRARNEAGAERVWRGRRRDRVRVIGCDWRETDAKGCVQQFHAAAHAFMMLLAFMLLMLSCCCSSRAREA